MSTGEPIRLRVQDEDVRAVPFSIEERCMRFPSLRLFAGVLLVVTAVINIVCLARAADECCAHCGCLQGCQKVCRLVCEQKKITTTCWGSKCEDFCIPGPSKSGCKHCETVCEECSDPKSPCVQPKRLIWTEWIPSSSAKVYTKKKLMKRTVTTTVPSYKWVVEDLCPHCEGKCAVVNIPPGADVPPAPTVDAKIK